MLVRPFKPEDAAAIADIYRPYVEKTTITAEEVAPDADEIIRRWQHLKELGLPYLVAEIDGEVAGYAYAGRFRMRSAYRYTVENSIYVSDRFHRRGVARELMTRLIEACSWAGAKQMIAVIADPEYNDKSVGLHTSLGFKRVALFEGIGLKFGRHLDVAMMQRHIG